MADQLDLLLHLERALTPDERKRLAKRTRSKKHGHAMAPGTGPAGETCGSCRHRVRGRRWQKCALRRATWTRSYGTDIGARDPACGKWEPQPDQAVDPAS